MPICTGNQTQRRYRKFQSQIRHRRTQSQGKGRNGTSIIQPEAVIFKNSTGVGRYSRVRCMRPRRKAGLSSIRIETTTKTVHQTRHPGVRPQRADKNNEATPRII